MLKFGIMIFMIAGAGMIVGATQADPAVTWWFAGAGIGMIGLPLIVVFWPRR